MTRARLISAVLLVALVAPGRASAQELHTTLTVDSGTGMSLGSGNDTVLKRRSPIFLDVDVGLVFDGDHAMEWTPSLIMEFEDKVSIGIKPSLKRVIKLRKLRLYGRLGFPFYFAPFTLLGAGVAIGAWYPIFSRFSVVLELRSDLFFVGSDLPDGSVLAKLDFAIGIRFDL
jgi:hypothetical protein